MKLNRILILLVILNYAINVATDNSPINNSEILNAKP